MARDSVILSRSRLAAERENLDVTFAVRKGGKARVRVGDKVGTVTVTGILKDRISYTIEREGQPPFVVGVPFRDVLRGSEEV